jgi:non-specific serine/threonine protein kinase
VTATEWQKVRELFERALEIAPEERAAFLADECGEAELRRKVEALLAAHERPGAFLAAPIADVRAISALVDEARRVAEEDDLPLGTVLDGKYRIEALVGRGGMGTVFRAAQLNLRRTVAVKLMRGTLLADRIACARFEREALAIARLKHPNIVTIHDLGVEPGLGAYLVMEFVEGRSLRQELDERTRLGVREALGLIGQVCAAVASAHHAQVVHRDLKPENIFLEAGEGDPTVKVLDFGLAKFGEAFLPAGEALTSSGAAPDASTLSGSVLGTPAYMAPEQCRGEAADARSDVYALGCVMYEMLAGRPPFIGPSPAQLLAQHLNEEPPRPSELAGEIAPALEAALLRALAREPDERHPSVDEFARELGVLGAARTDAAPGAMGAGGGAAQARSSAERDAGDRAPNNLPQPVTRFVGREQQIVEVRAWLERARLLTLVGPGGIGKTRLALEAARGALGAHPDGAWLVELDAVKDPSLVSQTVAGALGVREEAGRELAETLRAWLSDKRILLVLDNCEHLAEACAWLTQRLLDASAGLRVLATSREPLGIRGEVIWRVPPLAVPEAATSVTEALSSEAVRLFADRAQSSRPGFDVGEETAPAVVALCRRLEGIPLAIELAAARMQVLSVEQILARLDARFRLLTSGARAAPSRQRTLRATLDWSYDLLDEEERALLRRLSVFSGGATIDAVEAVCSDELVDALDALDIIARLVDKSLVIVRDRGGAARYGMLETVREYALERLEASGEAEDLKRRHAEFFLALGEAAAPEVSIPRRADWFERLESDHDNVRAALAWFAGNDAEACLQLAVSVWGLWHVHGHLTEGRGWLKTALEASGPAPTRARLFGLERAGVLANFQGDLTSARAYLAEGLHASKEANDSRFTAWFSARLGILACVERDLAAARGFAEQSLVIARTLGDEALIANSLNTLGEAARAECDWGAARQFYEQTLALHRRRGDCSGTTTALCNLGAVTFAEGDLQTASSCYREALAMDYDLGHRSSMSYSLDGLAAVAVRRREWKRAGLLAGAARALREAIGYELEPIDRAFREAYMAEARAARGRKTFASALAEGETLALERAVRLALGRSLARARRDRGSARA